MYNLFNNMILNEAVPRAAKSLGLNPEAPPDTTDPNAGQGDLNDPPPPDDSQNGDPPVPSGDITDDPDAGGGDPPVPSDDITDDPDQQGEDQEQDPDAQDDSLQGPDMGDGMDQPPDELQQAEQNLFQDLKPEQITIKTRELKERYKDLYDMIQEALEKIYLVSKTSYDMEMLGLIIRQLQTLKDLVIQSITKAFPTRTYVENRIELEKFATIFNAITNSVQVIYKARAKRTEKEEKLKKKRKEYNMYFSQDLGW